MSQEHLNAVKGALEELVSRRRGVMKRMVGAGSTPAVWTEFREIQDTIDALNDAFEEEEETFRSAKKRSGPVSVA